MTTAEAIAAAEAVREEITRAAQAADPTGHPRAGVTPHSDDARLALAAIGARRAAAHSITMEAMADLAAWAPAAQSAGLGIKEIAELAGASRGTIYATLREA